MIIGVLEQFRFTQVKNAAEAAFIIATEGGELCVLKDAGFGWGSQIYSAAPADWTAAVAAVSATAEFADAVAAQEAAASAAHDAAAARDAAMNCANADYGRVQGAIAADLRRKAVDNIAAHRAAYAAAIAAHGDIVRHGFIADMIADMERLAVGPREFAVTDTDVIAAVRSGCCDAAAVGLAIGAQDADEMYVVARKIGSMVRRGLLLENRRRQLAAV